MNFDFGAALEAAAYYLEHEPALYHCGIDAVDSSI